MTEPPPPDAPAFDLQVNGYAGVDFNAPGSPATPDAPGSPGSPGHAGLTAEGLHHACLAMQRDGVGGFLATVITDHLPAMEARLRRLAELRDADPLARRMMAGLHIEGPFINPAPGYVGAHPPDAVRPADPDTMRRLLDAGGGLVRLVTLAPEHDRGHATVRMLARQNITVSAGHCDPPLDQLDAAVDAGLSMFTHLGNGCPMSLHRHDNIIQRALSRADRLWLCFIADGVHVPFPALGNYLRLAGKRAVVTTDAMAAASLGPGRHRLGRWAVDVGDDLAAWAPDRSHLVGSAITMPQARRNLAHHLHLLPARVHGLTAANPRVALNLPDPDPGA